VLPDASFKVVGVTGVIAPIDATKNVHPKHEEPLETVCRCFDKALLSFPKGSARRETARN
jgi:hypothetical protein